MSTYIYGTIYVIYGSLYRIYIPQTSSGLSADKKTLKYAFKMRKIHLLFITQCMSRYICTLYSIINSLYILKLHQH